MTTEYVLPLNQPSTPSPSHAAPRRTHTRLKTLRIEVPEGFQVSDGGGPVNMSPKLKNLRRGTRKDLQEILPQDTPSSSKPRRQTLARGAALDLSSELRKSQAQRKQTRRLDSSRFATAESDPEPTIFVNPNEFILESDEEEIDDDDEDTWSASQRIMESGRISFGEAPAFADNLKQLDVFADATPECIVGALREARCKEGKADEVLWRRTAHDSPEVHGVLQLICPLCIILKGRVKVLKKHTQHKGTMLYEGDVVSAASANVDCLMAVNDCILLVAEVDEVREVCMVLKSNRDAVMTELRKTRPPSMWPDELLQKLVLVLRDLPFFEDLELSAVKRLARLVRYRACIQGEPLPPPKQAQAAAQSATAPDDNGDSSGLVVYLGGSAAVYTEVSPPHLEHTAPVAGPGSDENGRQSVPRMSRRSVAPLDITAEDACDSEQPAEDDAVVKSPSADVRRSNSSAPHIRYLRAVRKVQLGSVFGQGEVVEQHAMSKSELIVRCKSPCEIITLSRADYLKCMSDQQLEIQRIVHALRNVPPSLPGEPHHRSDEQLTLLCKMIENQREFKDFPRSTLMQIVGAATFLQAAPGHILCREGLIGDRFFAVIEGKVAVHKRADESEHKSLTGMLTSLRKLAEDEGDEHVKSKPNIFKTIARHRKRIMAAEAFQAKTKTKATVRFESGAEEVDEEDDDEEEEEEDAVPENGALPKRAPPSEPASLSITPTSTADFSLRSSKLFKRMVASAKAGGAEQLGRQLCRLGAGSAFGAMTLLKKEPRTASCKTLEPTKLFVVLRDHYVALCEAKEEAAEREAIDFLRHHLITQEHLKGPSGAGRIGAVVATAIQQRLNRLAKHITRCTLERGTVLVNHGAISKHVWLLRSGTLALCSPPIQASQTSAGNPMQRLPTRLRRGVGAATSASRLITSPGEVIGASHEVLGITEPCSVRVESATCELYKVSWDELKNVFTPKVWKAMLQDKLLQRQGQRGGQHASPKDLMASAAAECRKARVPSSEQQSVLVAVADAFDAVLRFQDGPGPGNGADALAAAEAAAKGPAALPFRSGRGPLGSHSGRKQDPACQGVTDKFEAGLKKAMAALEKATKDANAELHDTSQNIQIRNLEKPELPRPPPVTSAAHLRAQILQLLKNDTSEEMKKFITGVILDPQKGDLEAWVKKYLFGEHLKEHEELQDLHLLKRRTCLLGLRN
eukprot:TRINITY_DN14419_c0_g2_i1.p1 TRINITY_DN14419_c0_g2~~TRINITY_DN14419_c0_g2_i1.p1  ORF type:complete len:1198 (-),score=205.65 TRINITY_DN14419_c0_g2_i1:322-3915(-)